MIRRLLFVLVFSFALVFGVTAPVFAAPASSKQTATATSLALGIDISYPQCGVKLPKTQAFGIIGVNGGLATTTNPCLKDQLVWAKQSVGGTSQAKVQLYLNTANPGGLGTSSWPINNIDPSGNLTNNPYGVCDGKDTIPCAWQYGWNRAVQDVVDRFAPIAPLAGLNSDPANYTWWLDVETSNTWKLGGSIFDTQSNTAVLEGMTSYLDSVKGTVGLYSTAYQWSQIVGSSVSNTSNLNGLKNWRPGGANLTTAKTACTAKPLTVGGSVALTQFISKSLDYNYSCQ